MGCLQSKKDCGDIHPNVFRVLNIDETGADLWPGQLEVTETELILYREGRDATIWPLSSLRRYGFDADIFSIESGRRCPTGEGIYAFRCRRAAMLFSTLEQNIQMRNVLHETMPFQIPSNIINRSPQSAPRQMLQGNGTRSSVDNSLPRSNHRNNLNTHLPAQTTGPSTAHQSAGNSEGMPLYPRPQNSTSQVPNVYQMKDFKSREHNNNQAEQVPEDTHLYSNDVNKELAILRKSLHQEVARNNLRDLEEETLFLQNRYMNDIHASNKAATALSPTLSNASEHYAQLSIEQQQARLYMNMVPQAMGGLSDAGPATPLTPRPQPEYCNFNLAIKQEMNSYANLSLGEMASSSACNRRFSESDTFTPNSPVEEIGVNYAILDIDSNKEEGAGVGRGPAAASHKALKRVVPAAAAAAGAAGEAAAPAAPAGVGYTTIDFDKTVALTSVAASTDIDVDGERTTRRAPQDGHRY